MTDIQVPLSPPPPSSQQQQQNSSQNGNNSNNRWETIDDDYDGGNSTARLFERTRIQVLADEREHVQKKTFTKWVNSHLTRVGHRISDLYMDLRDGRMLIKLLEVLSGERLPRPTRGKMRIHCMENVDKALLFLHEQHVHLENIGAHDIVDGTPNLTLGLIWTIILRFQIQDITIEEIDNQETRSAKDALLLWCQIKTADYPNVNVRNFTTSWRDGLAFNALIHKHRADLVNYTQLKKENTLFNLNSAFNIAEKKLGIARLLDAEDINVDYPDEKSIMTYVVSFYHYFNKMKQDSVQGKRIQKVVNAAMNAEQEIDNYEKLVSDLIEWINAKIEQLANRDFANSLHGVQSQLSEFNQYRNSEKAQKFYEKGNLEVILFTLQSKMRANSQKPYQPKEGKLISDINKAWASLEKAEHERELALREEIVRQENLEQLAQKFNKKAAMRKKWLNDSQKLVVSDRFNFDLESVEAAFKKQEAIQTDIGAFERRVRNVIDIVNVLEKEKYHNIDKLNETKRNVLMLWQYLLELVQKRRQRLELCYSLQRIFQEQHVLLDCLNELKTRLEIDDNGKHSMAVKDLLERHILIESDIEIIRDKVLKTNQDILNFAHLEQQDQMNSELSQEDEGNDNVERVDIRRSFQVCDPNDIDQRVNDLNQLFDDVYQLSQIRRQKLEEARKFWQFMDDLSEEELWINEKMHLLSIPNAHDSDQYDNLFKMKKFSYTPKIIQNEMEAHSNTQLSKLFANGDQLIVEQNYGSEKIREKLDDLQKKWQNLSATVLEKEKHLNEIECMDQFFIECDDIDAYMFEYGRLVQNADSEDTNILNADRDELTVLNLLKKHKELQDEIENYNKTVENLNKQSQSLIENTEFFNRNETLMNSVKEKIDTRLNALDRRNNEIHEQCKLRKQKLNDALAEIRLNNDVDGVNEWLNEKERFLDTLDPTIVKDIEELEVIKHRFDAFERDMNSTASKVAVINQIYRQVQQTQEAQINDIESNTNTNAIKDKVNNLNTKWSNLRKLVDKKRDDLNSTYCVQTFYIESNETISWIQDKIRTIQSTEELGNDLTGVMTMQRRLCGLERDMAAIQSKLDQLESQASELDKTSPQESADIREKIQQITQNWSDLKDTLKSREESMGEAAELQKFLRDLDHFSEWLTRTQRIVASEEPIQSLSEAEQSLNQHSAVKEEIDRYAPDYERMRDYGQNVITNADTTDPQYIFLRERLSALDDGWNELDEMWRQKQSDLSEAMNYQLFERDASQAEVLLSNQEYYLNRQEQPRTLEEAENLIRRHEDFITSCKANEEKIEGVKNFAERLVEDSHYQAQRIIQKASDINDRFLSNKKKAQDMLQNLKDSIEYFQYLQEVDELKEWLDLKSIQAQDDSHRGTRNIHTIYLRHKAFESEIQSNRNRLDSLEQNAQRLASEKLEIREEILLRLTELKSSWTELTEITRVKGEKLFDANRGLLYEQSVDSIDMWIKDMEKHVQTQVSEECDLTTINILITKQSEIEEQLLAKQRQVVELEEQARLLKEYEPHKSDDVDYKRIDIQDRFSKIIQPLEEQKRTLEQHKRTVQFVRDCEDELSWIDEKISLAESNDFGSSLVSVKMLQRKNDALQKEVDNHEVRLMNLISNGDSMIQEGHPRSEEFQQNIGQLLGKWQNLKQAISERREHLLVEEKIQQYLFDCSEAEAWMGEQELYMMTDEKSKDEIGAQHQLNKHEQTEQEIEAHAAQIKQLGDTSRSLLVQANQDKIELITKRQMQIDKLYAGLKDLAQERRASIEEAIKFYIMKRDIDDLEQWIVDKEIIANSQELGQDFDHVNLIKERFAQFALDTQLQGQERINIANDKSNLLIDFGHVDAATIAQLKDNLNLMWDDLLELIETRKQMLEASWELHKFYSNCKQVLAHIEEKKNAIPEENGRDAQSVAQLQRKHAQFENDLITLGGQVHAIREESAKLYGLYAGDKAKEIQDREDQVLIEWKNLQRLIDIRKRQLADNGDLFKFFNMIRDLMMWIDSIQTQMSNIDKPRDVSGVELLINNHQSLKAEIDARVENFTICLNLGKDLINRSHPRSLDVKEKCIQLCLQRDLMSEQWDERWEHLQLMLEVYQFARDATVAEQWLIGQEPYLQNEDLGDTLDQVEILIKKHEAFEKSMFAQEDRFNALRKLTTLELKQKQPPPQPRTSKLPLYQEEFKTIEEREADLKRLQEEEQAREEEQRRINAEKEELERKKREQEAIQQSSPIIEQSKLEISTEDVHHEGSLSKKHEWESVNRKASNRSWSNVYCVINGNRFEIYKDQKHFKSHKSIESLSLNGSSAEQAVDYKKKEHVFRLKLGNGGQYLFKCKDDDEMRTWIQKVNSIAGETSQLDTSKTKSLPPPEKRSTLSGSSIGAIGTTGSLRKDFNFKK